MLSAFKAKSAKQKPAAKTAINPIQLGVFALVLALNAGWIYWSYQTFVFQPSAAKLNDASLIQANEAVERVKFRVGKLQGLLEQFSQRPALIEALNQSNSDGVSPWLESLIQALPEGSQATMVRNDYPPDSQRPEFDFRFAELDMINRSKKGESPPAEVGGLDADRVMTLVVPLGVTEEGRTKAEGTLVARVPAAFLRQALRSDNSMGELQLVQSFNTNRPETIAQIGSGRGPVVSSPVNAIWSVHFQADDALIKRSQSNPLILYISWAVLLAASLFGASVLSKKLIAQEQLRKQRMLNPDQTAGGQQPGGKLSQPTSPVMGVKVTEEDQTILAGEGTGRTTGTSKAAADNNLSFPKHVFRSYDIRGLAGSEITRDFATQLGKAIGTRILNEGGDSVFVGRDGRASSPEFCQALIDGILSTGTNVGELGLVPSPLLYYAIATSEETKNGVIVTASHNGPDYNGFKICLNDESLSDDAIQQLRQAMTSGNFQTGHGSVRQVDITEPYIDEILSDVALMGDVKLVIDAGNGATSEVAPLLFTEMGCDVVPLYCEFDGSFPNHDPDPSNPDNLKDLIDKVVEEEADLGVAFDGDGDRIFVVTASGTIITPDRLLMLFAKDIVSRNPGTDVVFDVKCTRQLSSVISSYGGRPIMWKTGHAHMKAKIRETEALLGGEYSGHIFIKDRWYGFDDGMLVAARLLEIMSLRDQSLDDIFAAFPVLPATPEIRIPVPEEKKFAIVQRLAKDGDFQSGTASTVDGLRVDFAKGWGLVRASNTGPELTLRFEGDNDEVIEQLKMLFKRELGKVDDSLALDF